MEKTVNLFNRLSCITRTILNCVFVLSLLCNYWYMNGNVAGTPIKAYFERMQQAEDAIKAEEAFKQIKAAEAAKQAAKPVKKGK